MARIRTIKPEFWTSPQIVECSRDARLLFIGLWNFCDDAGRHVASPKRLQMEVLAGDALGTQEVTQWVRELIAAGLVAEYEIDGQGYWEVTGWYHQRIDQPRVKYPSESGTMDGNKPCRLGGKQRQLVYKRLIARDGEKCCNCGATQHLAVDHILPISTGGSNDLDNLRLLCKLCNSEKGAKIPAGDATGTRQVRDGDAPLECKGMEGNGRESKGRKRARGSAAFSPLDVEFLEVLNTPQFRDAWKGWCQHRVEIRKPLTPTSVSRQLKELAGWGQARAIAAIEHTVAKGWQGIREPETAPGSQTRPGVDMDAWLRQSQAKEAAEKITKGGKSQ